MSETISAPTAEPGAAPVIPLPNVTEHPEPGGRELDDANVLCRGVIRVEPPTQELVELLGSLDVGHGDDVDLEVHGDSRYAGVRLLLFHAGTCLIHVIHLSLIELNFAPDRLKATGRPDRPRAAPKSVRSDHSPPALSWLSCAGFSRAAWRRARRCVRSTAPAPAVRARSPPAPARSAR